MCYGIRKPFIRNVMLKKLRSGVQKSFNLRFTTASATSGFEKDTMTTIVIAGFLEGESALKGRNARQTPGLGGLRYGYWDYV